MNHSMLWLNISTLFYIPGTQDEKKKIFKYTFHVGNSFFAYLSSKNTL